MTEQQTQKPVERFTFHKVRLFDLITGEILDKRSVGVTADRMAAAIRGVAPEIAAMIIETGAYSVVFGAQSLTDVRFVIRSPFASYDGYGGHYDRPFAFGGQNQHSVAIFGGQCVEGILIHINPMVGPMGGGQYGAAGIVTTVVNILLAGDVSNMGFGK